VGSCARLARGPTSNPTVRAIRILIFVSFHEAKASQTSHSILSESLVISPIVVKLPRASPGVSPKLTASHRSLRRRSEHSERHRSSGEAPKPRSGAEATEALRSYGETPILRRDTEAPEPLRTLGESPKLRRDSDPSEKHRSSGVAPKLRSGAEATERRRSLQMASRKNRKREHAEGGSQADIRFRNGFVPDGRAISGIGRPFRRPLWSLPGSLPQQGGPIHLIWHLLCSEKERRQGP
jgi:hypothetical protein